MSDFRFNQVGIVIGMRGTGKSLFILGSKYSSKSQDANLGIKNIIDIYLNKNMKVLIIDTLDHPSYRKIPIIDQKNFPLWNKGVVRTYLEPEYIPLLVAHINKTNDMNNTAIIFEDAGKYTDTRLPRPFKRLIADSKQRNIDIIFMYHCFMDTPTDVFRKGVDYIKLFKTEDSPIVRKNNLRLFDKVLASYERVKNDRSNFYGETIDTRTN